VKSHRKVRTIARRCLTEMAYRLGMDRVALSVVQRACLNQRSLLCRIVNFHGTPARDSDPLTRQLEYVTSHFCVLDVTELIALLEGTSTKSGATQPFALITFDDGLASNYHVAAPLLESLGLHGLFFIVPDFAISGSQSDSRAYFCTNISPGRKPSDLTLEDYEPMTPDQIADLVQRGYAIGNHTLSHVRLDRLRSPDELRRQIIDSQHVLAEWTGQPISCFAWPFAWDAITPQAWSLAAQSHSLCFGACPGFVHFGIDDPHLLWRTHVEADYPPAEYRCMYTGIADPFWSRQRQLLRRRLLGEDSKRR